MKFVLPLVLLVAGLRVIIYPRISSWRFGWSIDLSGYEFLIGGTFVLIGAIALAEALGYLKRGSTRP